MRIALVLLALSGTAFADPPSVSPDGKRILIPYVGEDGARGSANLTMIVDDRAGRQLQRIPVIAVDTGEVPGGEKARAKLLASTKWQPMVESTAKVELADGQLTLTPPGHAPVVVKGGWRVTPDLRKQAELDRAAENGTWACWNPAELGTTWIDEKHRAAVVMIRFHGNDSCWEPDSEFAIVTW